MKKLMVILGLGAILSGCAGEPVYETIADVWEQTEPAANPGRMEVPLPDGAEMEVMDANGDGFYRIGDWELWTKILPGGDLQKTVQTLSGMDGDALTVIHRKLGDYDCHETTWTAAGEEGTRVIRAGILEDGGFHYCLCVSVPEEDAGEAGEMFSQVLRNVTVTGIAP